MMDIPEGASKEEIALIVAKQNHGGSIVYLLQRVQERIDRIKKEDLAPEEADFLETVAGKVKAATDAMKDWSDDGDD